MANGDDKDKQYQLQEGETFVPRQKPAASTPNHPALAQGETFVPRAAAAPAPTTANNSVENNAPPKNYGFTWPNVKENVKSGLEELGTGAWGMGRDVLFPEGKTEGQKLNWLANKYVFNPADEQARLARRPSDPNHPYLSGAESIGHSVAEAIPVLGPWAAGLGEQAGTGDVGGALAKGATQVWTTTKAIPKVAELAGHALKVPVNIYRGAKALNEFGKTGEVPAPVERVPLTQKAGRLAGKVAANVPGVPAAADWAAAHVEPVASTLEKGANALQPTEINLPSAADVREYAKNQLVTPKAAPKAAAQAVAPAPVPATIPAPNEVPAVKSPSLNKQVGNIVDQVIPPKPPLKPNVPLRDQITMAKPGELPAAKTPEEAQFHQLFGPEYAEARDLAEWETGHPEGIQTPEQKAAVTQEWNKPKEPAAEPPKRTSAHHVYGDVVGEELRDQPELQKYFTGKKGEGFTNVKARQAAINGGIDMGQRVVNEKMLQGEGSITPKQVVEQLRAKGYTMAQIRDLAEKPIKKTGE